MPILDRDLRSGQLEQAFIGVDRVLSALEHRLKAGEMLPLAGTVEQTIALATRPLGAYIAAEGRKAVPDTSADILEVFKVLAKGEPSWTAIRDNCRQLVYYRNQSLALLASWRLNLILGCK